ncbi:MAG: V-type ATP synthase subunit D [Spirochaetes bacterium GWF1_41_5]|nr:MAG: V-type ATP synthase subunit D [Spirochaetes bacterium GWF1_41_5]HBE02213.1 V-type ATP synthase subunit D [Spirochaetia bacterium]
MAVKFQYNKTSMQIMRRQLQIREKALPTLKSKEAALRVEVKKISDKKAELENSYRIILSAQESINRYWCEFPDLISVSSLKVASRKIAGIKIPILDEVNFKITDFPLFSSEAWFPEGIERIKKIITLSTEIGITEKQFITLNYARKKTTQKVNLYEKVQIPQFKDAIIKIKRFMEDEENLSKSSQKIVKERNRAKEAAL